MFWAVPMPHSAPLTPSMSARQQATYISVTESI